MMIEPLQEMPQSTKRVAPPQRSHSTPNVSKIMGQTVKVHLAEISC
jgi:hypothetical protein